MSASDSTRVCGSLLEKDVAVRENIKQNGIQSVRFLKRLVLVVKTLLFSFNVLQDSITDSAAKEVFNFGKFLTSLLYLNILVLGNIFLE